MNETIILNSGHSNLKPGALSRYGIERDLNIAVTDELIPELERQGFKVKYVPDELNLTKSIDWVNERTSQINDGLALSVHFNASEIDDESEGAETYYYGKSKPSKAIAQKLIDEYCKETDLKNRGAKSDIKTRWHQLGWIRKTNVWATLIECGFMDNTNDMNKIIGHFDIIARGIAKGVCAIYGITYKEPEPSSETNEKSLALDDIVEILKKRKIIK